MRHSTGSQETKALNLVTPRTRSVTSVKPSPSLFVSLFISEMMTSLDDTHRSFQLCHCHKKIDLAEHQVWCSGDSEGEVAQSCPILCDPMDCSLLGSSGHGIFQARIPEWVATSSSAVIFCTQTFRLFELLVSDRGTLTFHSIIVDSLFSPGNTVSFCFANTLFCFSWRRQWQPTPVFLPGKSHGQESLVGYSPWG